MHIINHKKPIPMLKSITNLSGSTIIEKSAQRNILGGTTGRCTKDSDCPGGRCIGGIRCAY